jgi:hypothetical protein
MMGVIGMTYYLAALLEPLLGLSPIILFRYIHPLTF